MAAWANSAGATVNDDRDEDNLTFREAMRDVRRLRTADKRPPSAPKPPPRARFTRADQQEVLKESLLPPSDEAMLATGDELSFRRPHIPEGGSAQAAPGALHGRRRARPAWHDRCRGQSGHARIPHRGGQPALQLRSHHSRQGPGLRSAWAGAEERRQSMAATDRQHLRPSARPAM